MTDKKGIITTIYNVIAMDIRNRLKEVGFMKRIFANIYMRLLKVLNVMGSAVLFWLSWHYYYSLRFRIGLEGYGDVLVILIYCIIQILLNKTYNAFDIGSMSVGKLFYSLSIADAVGSVIYIVIMTLGWADIPNPFPLMGVFAVQVIWNAVWSFFANHEYFRIYKAQKTAVIYGDTEDIEKLSELGKYKKKYSIEKYVSIDQPFEKILDEIKDMEAVFVTGVDVNERNAISEECILRRINMYFIPNSNDVIVAGAKHLQMFSVPILIARRKTLSPEYMLIKRAIDIAASIMAIIVFSPIMLITALCVKLYDRGPVFYKQVRLTKDRKEFRILKFRSMRVDAEKDGVARLASQNDDRITPVGKIIRALRIDEMPQLLNILGGSMTIVGPRPERPEIAEQYEKEIPSFALRLQVKAGLTGYAQIYGRYNTLPYDKLQMDLLYINRMSLLEDIQLMLATIKILFMRESTEGVQTGQTTAAKEKKPGIDM